MYELKFTAEFEKALAELDAPDEWKQRARSGLAWALQRQPTVAAWNVEGTLWVRRVVLRLGVLAILVYYQVDPQRRDVTIVGLRIAPPVVTPL